MKPRVVSVTVEAPMRDGMRLALAAVGAVLAAGGIVLLGAAGLPGEDATAAREVTVMQPAVAPEPIMHEPPAVGELQAATGVLDVAGRLSVPLDRTAVVNGVVDPPLFDRAYIVDGYGELDEPGGATVFVAIHSAPWDVPGNALIGGGSIVVQPGERITVDGAGFTVTDTLVVPKSNFASIEQLWDGTHDLALLVCVQHVDGRPSDAGAILAQRVQPERGGA